MFWCRPTVVHVEVVHVHGAGVPRRRRRLPQGDGREQRRRVKVEGFLEAVKDLLVRNVEAVAGEEAVVGCRVEKGAGAAAC